MNKIALRGFVRCSMAVLVCLLLQLAGPMQTGHAQSATADEEPGRYEQSSTRYPPWLFPVTAEFTIAVWSGLARSDPGVVGGLYLIFAGVGLIPKRPGQTSPDAANYASAAVLGALAVQNFNLNSELRDAPTDEQRSKVQDEVFWTNFGGLNLWLLTLWLLGDDAPPEGNRVAWTPTLTASPGSVEAGLRVQF